MKALLAGAFALAALFVHRPARACDCATPEPAATAARASLATVIHGRVLALRSATGGGYQVELFVVRAWKGATAGDVVTLPIDASSCGYVVVPGDELLIYAPAAGPVRQCAGADTARVRWGAAIDADAAVLGPPTSTATPATPAASAAPTADVVVEGKVLRGDVSGRGWFELRTTRASRGALRRQTLRVISSIGTCAITPPRPGARVAVRAIRARDQLVVSACIPDTGVRSLGRPRP